MLVHNCFFILGVWYIVDFQSVTAQSKPGDKQVNAYLGLVLTFNDQEKNLYLPFQNARKSNTPLKQVNEKVTKKYFKDKHIENFVDCIQNGIEIITKFNDNDLKRFLTVFNDEIKQCHIKDSKLKDIIKNVDLRRFINNNLDKINSKPLEIIRQSLSKVAKALKEENQHNNSELTVFLNSLFTKKAIKKFKTFIINMDEYRLKARNDIDLTNILRQIKNIVFDHYSKLNNTVKATIQSNMQNYLNMLVKTSKDLLSKLTNTKDNTTQSKYTTKSIVQKKQNKKHRHKKSHKPTTTTEVYRTFRQMYVEKNIDLKYNPYAYDRFTTAKKVKKHKISKQSEPTFRAEKSEISNEKLVKTLPNKKSASFMVKKDVSKARFNKKSEVNIERRATEEIVTENNFYTDLPLKSYIPNRIKTAEQYKYEIHMDKPRFNFKEPDLQLKKPEYEFKVNGLHFNEPKPDNKMSVWQILNMPKVQYQQKNMEKYLIQPESKISKDRNKLKSRKNYKDKPYAKNFFVDNNYGKITYRKSNTNITVEDIVIDKNISNKILFVVDQRNLGDNVLLNNNTNMNRIINKTILNDLSYKSPLPLLENNITNEKQFEIKVNRYRNYEENELRKIQELKYYPNLTHDTKELPLKERLYELNLNLNNRSLENHQNQNINLQTKINLPHSINNVTNDTYHLNPRTREEFLMRARESIINVNEKDIRTLKADTPKDVPSPIRFNGVNNSQLANLNQTINGFNNTMNRNELNSILNDTVKNKTEIVLKKQPETENKDLELKIANENKEFLNNEKNRSQNTTVIDLFYTKDVNTSTVFSSVLPDISKSGRRRYSKMRNRKMQRRLRY